MACGNDDKEIAAESPYHRAEHRQMLTEIESPQQDIETEHIHKYIPYVFRQPKMKSLTYTANHLVAIVRRSYLISGHAAEKRVGPAGTLSGTLQIF